MKQTMVKDIKLREIVPKEKHICVNPDDSTSSWGKQRKRQGYNESINKVLSTDISNVEEYVCLDMDKMLGIIFSGVIRLSEDEFRQAIVDTKASSGGVMKWRK